MFCCTKETYSVSNLRGLLSSKTCSCGKENKNKSNNPITTVSSDSTIGEKKAIKCRSKKNKVENEYEISFEKGILTEHKNRFKILISNYDKQLSNILTSSKFHILQIHNQNNQLQDSFENSQLTKLIQSCELLTSDEQAQFIQDLKSEENFAGYLLYMLKTVAEEAKSDLVFIASFIWEEYLIQIKKPCKIKSLIASLKSLARTKMSEIMKFCEYLCGGNKQKNDISLHFTTLVNGLIETIVLVIENYYECSVDSISDQILVPNGKLSDLSLDGK